MPDSIYDHIELLGPRVLVRPLPDLEFIAAGLLVRPDSTRHSQNRAVVEKVGDTRELQQGDTTDYALVIARKLQRGDLVFYQKFAGTYITLGDHERLMLNGDEVQGRVPEMFVHLVAHTADEASDVERRVRALNPESQGPTLSATEHLEGEPCLICREKETLEDRERQAEASKSNLATMREALRQSRQESVSGSSPRRAQTLVSSDDDESSSR